MVSTCKGADSFACLYRGLKRSWQMRRLQLSAVVAPLLLALACRDATAPRPAAFEIRVPQHALAIASTTPRVTAGALLTCAVNSDATVVCWGDNAYGELNVPTGLASVAEVSAGARHACALKTDGTVVCWGDNAFGGEATVPDGLASVAQVSADGFDTCALKTDGTVVCWGDNANGQATVPEGLAPVAEVSAGFHHTCVLKRDGTVVCWGYNFYGQTTVPDGLASVAQVSAGDEHTCALKTDATVVCWGYNGDGETTVPTGLASVAQVSAGAFHTCALKTDGRVVCWGNNPYGQTSVPAGLTSVAQVSAGYFHTCALKTDGTVVCWGGNTYGQATVPAGLNLNPPSTYTPTAAIVGPLSGPIFPFPANTYIGASASFTYADHSDTHTAVFTWGDGTSSVPVVMPDGNGFGPAYLTESSGSGFAYASHSYSTAGVYTITLTVTDRYGLSAQSVFEFAVVYDPAAGFVTGGGWINSPAGAYAADPTLTGRANFGFVSRYQKGAAVPSGDTEFQFQAGNLKFKSTTYDWLVISGPQAKYKGSGSINGGGDFGFLLSAVDGAVTGGGGTDKFRIKIWNKVTGTVIYDNQTGGTEDAAATTMISGGDIVIHS
jgi:alpha-tubulin suppressor-like RCC1 family protein